MCLLGCYYPSHCQKSTQSIKCLLFMYFMMPSCILLYWANCFYARLLFFFFKLGLSRGRNDHTIEGGRVLKTMTPNTAADHSQKPTHPCPWQMSCHRVALTLIKVWKTISSWAEKWRSTIVRDKLKKDRKTGKKEKGKSDGKGKKFNLT